MYSIAVGEDEPLRLYLVLSFLFHGETSISTFFTPRTVVTTVSGDSNTFRATMSENTTLYFEIFEALSDSQRSGEDNLDPVKKEKDFKSTNLVDKISSKLKSKFMSIERLEALIEKLTKLLGEAKSTGRRTIASPLHSLI